MNQTSNQGNANSVNNEIAFFTDQTGKNLRLLTSGLGKLRWNRSPLPGDSSGEDTLVELIKTTSS